MSVESHVSLIDLSKQLPFQIDQYLKEQICFGETLIVSCGHYEGDVGDDDGSESEWTCEESNQTEPSEEAKETAPFEVKDFIPEDAKEVEEEEDDDDFFFYFFPDCNKPPPPQNSKTSIIVENGLPKINPAAKSKVICTCKKDKTGQCECYVKIPCQCGAKVKAECTCKELKNICVCHPGYPETVCKCKSSDVCVCDPDGKIFPVCTCAAVEKPCICHPKKFPSPVCKCKYKPKLLDQKPTIYESVGEEDMEAESEESKVGVEGESEREPCDCQKPDPKPTCFCIKGRPCLCKDMCICDVQKICVCEPTESQEIQCINVENKIGCTCSAVPKVCDCADEEGGVCKCFPANLCTCGNPQDCKCYTTCDCTIPCICDTTPAKKDECICLDVPKAAGMMPVCTCACKEDKAKRMKRVRAGKEGYRWCHEVDPRHNFFDFSYNRHDDLVNAREPEPEKFKILGLDHGSARKECPVHGPKLPKYERKHRKPSIDCCSAVGGMSICVETLGEDKDKFLVQVVSYSSKEGAKTGSKLVSILDCNLHTMEENRIEHITKRDLTKERRNYMAICENGYYNKVTRMCGDKHVIQRLYHNFEKAHNFILEGANIVLLRYIGIQRYKGTIKTETVMMDGTICESIYICHGVSQGIVNSTPLFVTKVERHIIQPNGYIHQTLTVMTLKGYIVSHEWADNCYILHVNPLLRILPERDEIEPHAPLREGWREDLQLMSDFLDYKTTRISEGGRYVTESGALTGTVRDYLQAILLLRPQDTLHFTRHYFGAVLSALDLPHDEFFDSSSKHVRYYFFED